MSGPCDTPAELAALVADAVRARTRLRARAIGDTAEALGAAAARWGIDAELLRDLPAVARLSAPVVAAAVRIAAAALDTSAMLALVEHEFGAGAAGRPAPAGPSLVGHVLAGNVPALGLPAIALGCLVGAAVVVKSGRDDPLSAPAFHRALAAVDPALAATVVTAYWPGGERAWEEAAFARADVVVASGTDETVAALAGRLGARLLAHGERVSVAAVSREGLGRDEPLAERLALDVALHDQRGCLSPCAVYVEADGRLSPMAFAERLAAALDTVARALPPGPATIEERAARRTLEGEAEWEPRCRVLGGAGGLVVYDPRPAFRPIAGRRAIRLHPLDTLAALPVMLPRGRVECVGLAASGPETAALVPALRALGVARICPIGRMQQPTLAWPRSQRLPLGSLLGRPGPSALEVEA